jgi:hypothetical protein
MCAEECIEEARMSSLGSGLESLSFSLLPKSSRKGGNAEKIQVEPTL